MQGACSLWNLYFPPDGMVMYNLGGRYYTSPLYDRMLGLERSRGTLQAGRLAGAAAVRGGAQGGEEVLVEAGRQYLERLSTGPPYVGAAMCRVSGCPDMLDIWDEDQMRVLLDPCVGDLQRLRQLEANHRGQQGHGRVIGRLRWPSEPTASRRGTGRPASIAELSGHSG